MSTGRTKEDQVREALTDLLAAERSRVAEASEAVTELEELLAKIPDQGTTAPTVDEMTKVLAEQWAEENRRVLDRILVLTRAADILGDAARAVAWFNYQPIAAFGGKTASELVSDGRRDAVLLHLDTLENGVFA